MKKEASTSFMHIVLWSFCVIFFIFQYGIRSTIPSVLNEELLHHFSITASELGGLISTFFFAYMIMQVPVGLIIDRFSIKTVSIFAFCCASIGIIAFSCTNSFFVASLSQIFLGFGCSFAFVLVMKVTNHYFQKEKVALVSSIGISLGSLGPVVTGPLLAYLSEIYPWKSVVITIASFGFIISLIGYLFIDEKKLPNLSHATSENNEIKSYGIIESLKLIISNKQYFLIGIFSMLILGPISAFCDAWGLSFVKSVYGVDKIQAAYVVSLVYTGTIFGGPLFAYLSKKLESFKIPMILGSTLLLILLSIVVFIKVDFKLLGLLLFVIGVLSTCQFLAFPAAISLAPKEISATLTGVVNMITMSGCVLMIRVVGWLMDVSKKNNIEGFAYSTQDYTTGMISLLVSISIAIVFVLFIKNDYRK